MKAIYVEAAGGPEVLKYQDVPDPTPGTGQVLVKVEAAGINFADVYARRGRGTFPSIAGQEAAGVVEALGPDVTTVKVGDRVAYNGAPGAYAEKQVVNAARLVPVPEGLSTKVAAAALLQGMTAHYLATSTYELKAGDTCLVHAAAGGVGLLLCQIAKMRGARVIGTVSSEEKAKAAREAGADEVINYETSDFVEEVKKLTDGKGVNVVYDSVGKTTFLKGFDVLKPFGVMAIYGSASGEPDPIDTALLNAKGCVYVTRANLGTYTATREELVRRSSEVYGWIASGKLKVRIFGEYPLADAAKAHAALEQRETIGKLILVP
jgi:NADPH2:quinone reductase